MNDRHSFTISIDVTVHDVEALAAHFIENRDTYIGYDISDKEAKELITNPGSGEIDFEVCCRLILDRGCDIPGMATEEVSIRD